MITASYTMSQTSVHSSSATLFIRSNPLNLLSLPLYNHRGFDLPRLSEQDPVSPTVSLSHQEASITSYPCPSEGRQNENHNHRKLIKLITWTTALSNSMKLCAMLCRATQVRQVMMDSSDKMWSTGEGNDNLLQYSCLENPMNSMKSIYDT